MSGLHWHFELSKVSHVAFFGNSNLSILSLIDERDDYCSIYRCNKTKKVIS